MNKTLTSGCALAEGLVHWPAALTAAWPLGSCRTSLTNDYNFKTFTFW